MFNGHVCKAFTMSIMCGLMCFDRLQSLFQGHVYNVAFCVLIYIRYHGFRYLGLRSIMVMFGVLTISSPRDNEQ